jgi:phosphoribosylanthranilate isomerase
LEAGADAIGMVFHEASPRRVDRRHARQISRMVSGRADCVGVVVESSPEELSRLVEEFELTAVQLRLRSCPRTLPGELGVPVWPYLGVEELGPHFEIDWWPGLPVFIDHLDADGAGGTGEPTDLRLAAALAAHRPVWLAGGIGPDNVAEAVAAVRPYGVDASSALEASPGIKDPQRVAAYVQRARAAATAIPQTGSHHE